MNKHTSQLCCMLACVAGMSLCLPPAGASVVVDNGAPDHQSGQNMNYAFQAEDFKLASAATINSIVFWTLEAPGAYRGSFAWAIVDNAGGAPGGTVYAAGNAGDALRSATGNYLGRDEFRNALTLFAPLSAGNYWLVLHNGAPSDLTDSAELLWETRALNASATGVEAFSTSGPWTGTYAEHAFQLAAVPEPGAVTMLLAGIAAVGGLGALRARGGAQ